MDTEPTPSSTELDRLLSHRAEIAEFVNSFQSKTLQKQALDAVVKAFGLSDATAPVAPVERLRVVPEVSPEVTVTPQEPDGFDADVAAESPSPRRRPARSSTKKNFVVPRGLVFAPEGHPTFEELIAEKAPRNNDERMLVACYYLTEMMGITEVGIGHILAAYQAAEWPAPAHPDTALRAGASRTGWLDTGDTKAVKVVWKGQNHLMTKMPVEPKKKTS